MNEQKMNNKWKGGEVRLLLNLQKKKNEFFETLKNK